MSLENVLLVIAFSLLTCVISMFEIAKPAADDTGAKALIACAILSVVWLSHCHVNSSDDKLNLRDLMLYG